MKNMLLQSPRASSREQVWRPRVPPSATAQVLCWLDPGSRLGTLALHSSTSPRPPSCVSTLPLPLWSVINGDHQSAIPAVNATASLRLTFKKPSLFPLLSPMLRLSHEINQGPFRVSREQVSCSFHIEMELYQKLLWSVFHGREIFWLRYCWKREPLSQWGKSGLFCWWRTC